MIKRYSVLALAVAFVACMIIRPVAALSKEDYQVLNFEDYITDYEIDDRDNAWTNISLPGDICGTMVIDRYGTTYRPGSYSGSAHCDPSAGNTMGVASYFPGSYVTGTFMDLSNIPNGSRMGIRADFVLYGDDYQSAVSCNVRVGVQYFDTDFNNVGFERSLATEWIIDYDHQDGFVYMDYEITKPANAAYFVFYATCDMTVLRSNETVDTCVNVSFMKPTLKIATSAWEIIVNGIVNGKDPAGSGDVGDLGDAEDSLFGDTSGGLDLSDQYFNSAQHFITSQSSGFLFLTGVVNHFVDIPWFKGVLTISLSLGIFAFLTNIIMSAGRSVERRAGRGGGKD